MKKIFFILMIICCSIQLFAQTYTASAENLANRNEFRDDKFGMFIHWGLSSVLGAGEWVMNNRSRGVGNE